MEPLIAIPKTQDDLPVKLPESIAKATASHQATKQPLRILSTKELLKIPKPDYLIEGIIERNSFTMMYGGPGSGKTFAALDIALHIAMGKPWMGHAVRTGSVLYVAAEGYQSLARRLHAWMQYYSIDEIDNIRFVVEPVNLLGGPDLLEHFITEGASAFPPRYNINDDDEIVDYVEYPPIELIIFDTLARCIIGADENDAKDMGRIVQWLDWLRDHKYSLIDPAVMIIHHSGKYTQFERGSTVMRGAADTMLQMKSDGYGPTLLCSKQKNDEPFTPKRFLIHKLESGDAVLVPRETPTSETLLGKSPIAIPLGPRQQSVLALVKQSTETEVLCTQPLIVKTLVDRDHVTPAAVYNAMRSLYEHGMIQKNDKGAVSLTAKGANWEPPAD